MSYPAEAPAPEPNASEPSKADTGESAEKADEPKKEDADETQKEARDINYTQTGKGMKVEVGGVRFMATVKPVKVGGGWGLELEVEATSTDGKPHKLLSPKNGPLAFGGKVDRSGKAEQLTDKRDGDKEETLTKEPFNFGRTWPAKGEAKPLQPATHSSSRSGSGVSATTASLAASPRLSHREDGRRHEKPQPVSCPPTPPRVSSAIALARDVAAVE